MDLSKRQTSAKLTPNSTKAYTEQFFQKVDNIEFNFCMKANSLTSQRAVKSFFCGISRAGDGVFWYSCMALLPIIHGSDGWRMIGHMVLCGIISAICYKQLKSRLVRERPYISFKPITAGTRPLDRYSFPSGHTMHAVGFTVVLLQHSPLMACVVLPFTLLVMCSRVILGLHYPSDVVVGALLGAALGWSTSVFFLF